MGSERRNFLFYYVSIFFFWFVFVIFLLLGDLVLKDQEKRGGERD